MIEFAVTVQGQRISCTKVKGELVSGAKGVKVQFTWSEEWQQLQRIGVFRAGSIARDVMDLQDECVIPWEVLMQPGQVLMIGVQGVNEEGTAVTPTLEAEMGEILRGADPSDDPSTEPTLPIWQWVKNLLEQVARLMEHSVLFTKQDLTHSEQAQARDNIGAADSDFVGDSAAALDAIIEMQEALLNASGTLPEDYGTPYAVEYIKQKLTEVAKAQARENIGAAPAGFGLGTQGGETSTNDASVVDTFQTNGWYKYYNDGVELIPGVAGSHACEILVEMFNHSYGRQTAYTINGYVAVRVLFDGTWNDWRVKNPQMADNVEYRTMEEWLGRAIYTRIVNVGAFPAEGSVAHFGLFDLPGARILRVSGNFGNRRVTVPHTDSEAKIHISGTDYEGVAYIVLYVEKGDFTDDTCIAQVWYTKD